MLIAITRALDVFVGLFYGYQVTVIYPQLLWLIWDLRMKFIVSGLMHLSQMFDQSGLIIICKYYASSLNIRATYNVTRVFCNTTILYKYTKIMVFKLSTRMCYWICNFIANNYKIKVYYTMQGCFGFQIVCGDDCRDAVKFKSISITRSPVYFEILHDLCSHKHYYCGAILGIIDNL